MTYTGIDISQYQDDIDLVNVINANEFNFVIMRGGFTGYGSGTPSVDTKFEDYYKLAKQTKANVGYYYLTIASTDAMVDKEYEFIINQLKDKEFDHVIGIDVENCRDVDYTHAQAWLNLSKSERTRLVHKLADKLEQAGYYVVIYCNYNYAVNKLESWLFDKHDFWYARYVVERPTYPKTPNLWQYTSSGQWIGYGDFLDTNYAYVDYTKIIKENGLNGFVKDEEDEVIVQPEEDYEALWNLEKIKNNQLQLEVDKLSKANEQMATDLADIKAKVEKY